jgi:hypothetical protein
MSVGKMILGKMTADKMFMDKMTVDEMSNSLTLVLLMRCKTRFKIEIKFKIEIFCRSSKNFISQCSFLNMFFYHLISHINSFLLYPFLNATKTVIATIEIYKSMV